MVCSLPDLVKVDKALFFKKYKAIEILLIASQK